MQVIRLRYLSLALLLMLLLSPASSGTSGYAAYYDVPGGERLIGPGREVLQVVEQEFGDNHLSVVRQITIVRTAAVNYRIGGAAELQKETVVSFEIMNSGEEKVGDIVIEQPVGMGETHSVHAGGLGAGEKKRVSFSFAGSQTDMEAPLLEYQLPQASLKVSDASVGEEVELWLRVGSTPVVGELIEVMSPSGSSFSLKTEGSGKAVFVSRETGPYLFTVPHRRISNPPYVYSLQKTEPPAQLAEESGSPGTAALLFGSVGSWPGRLVGRVGPLGIVVGIALLVLVGWTYREIRKPREEEEIVLGEERPQEIEKYGTFPAEDGEGIVEMPQKAMSNEEKLKMLEATIALTPKQRREKEWRGIPKAEKEGKARKKGRRGRKR